MREHWDLDTKIDFLNSQKEFIGAFYNWFGSFASPSRFYSVVAKFDVGEWNREIP